MSSRLKSFHGPSTPPVQKRKVSQPPQSPSSPSRQIESTFHRKTRTLLQDLRNVAQTWDDLVLVNGLQAARELTDTRTDLEYVPLNHHGLRKIFDYILSNALKLSPDRRPRTHLVRPNLAIMDECIAKLDTVVLKLVCHLPFLSIWPFLSFDSANCFKG
jgi:hypothetical protein